MLTNSNWTIDEQSRHVAHSSGLYAYFSAQPTDSGGILCVGPFSSYSQRLTKNEVLSYTYDAIHALENRFGPKTYYTIWGTYTQEQFDGPCKSRKIDILGECFEFVANPCFRTSALLSDRNFQRDTQEQVLKEWNWRNGENQISHRIGLCFTFSRNSKNRLHCNVSIDERTEDLRLLGEKLKPLLLRSLSTTAFAVLNKISEKAPQPTKESLSINVSKELLASD